MKSFVRLETSCAARSVELYYDHGELDDKLRKEAGVAYINVALLFQNFSGGPEWRHKGPERTQPGVPEKVRRRIWLFVLA